ncbi:NAD(P)/FAD-dependent oxidoreductase [Kitasatospora kifunensis]|uniref:Thioredoxin reductase (NADPH) n=1 Tax=Kitasatospora kifunensis TaxID=58351 RepID=A0A7W7R6Q4_KITKI|nr:NAD(P)/FAD-dependent oxidoreductase [Kitasatospora kifunensis]MBB4926254.1 thioredoxin reductase (NADPH) [Kitasatospora kifunensis]
MEDVLIIGGGAGGLSAALTLARARRRVLVVDAGSPRNAPAAAVHGFVTRDGTPPAELLAAGRAEVTRYGGRIVADEVRQVRAPARAGAAGAGFAVELAGGGTVSASRLIVATGLHDELPELPGLRERWGRDVLHCPYCHGWEVRGRPLGVLGAPGRLAIAVHQALLVRQWSPDVVLFTGGPDGAAASGAPDALEAADRVRLTARGVRIVAGEVSGLAVTDDELRGVRLADGSVVARAALFVAPRFVPNDALLTGLGCARDETGALRVDATGLTSVPGVWAVGNVADVMAQVAGAAAAGVKAGVAVNWDLIEEELTETEPMEAAR